MILRANISIRRIWYRKGAFMIFKEIDLPGVYIIEPRTYKDNRGIFRKIYHDSEFRKNGIDLVFNESFYTVSEKNVIRGMHFQVPPHDYCKLVYVPDGEILDVILDLRRNAPTFGKSISIILSGENARQVYIPKGFAHGFAVLSDSATVTYLQTAMHSAEHDFGIRWNSFGFDWGIDNPVLSERDGKFPPLGEFHSPF